MSIETEIATGIVEELTWDYRNRLTKVVSKDSNGNVIQESEYTYDVFDRRIEKSVDPDGDGAATAEVERFVYDGDHIALVFDGQGNQTYRYLHGTQIDQILAQEANGEVLWALTDNLGTVRDVVNSDRVVVNHITYDSFGKVTGETNPAVEFRFGYTGRELDSETGLYYYRARYYNPSAGRFINEDTIGFAGGDSNLYSYVFNSPVNYLDPSGHGALGQIIGGGIGAGVGGFLGGGVGGVIGGLGGAGTGSLVAPGVGTIGGGIAGGISGADVGIGVGVVVGGGVGAAIGDKVEDLIKPFLPDAPTATKPKPTPKPGSETEQKPKPTPTPPGIPEPSPTPQPVPQPKIDDPNDCEEEKDKCKYTIDENHLFFPDTKTEPGKIGGFHSTARALEGIHYEWVTEPPFDAAFEPFKATFKIPDNSLDPKKDNNFFPTGWSDQVLLLA